MVIALLAGGTGGAKLARGLRDELGGDGELRVIANTGDDIEIYGAYVSPDPDLISYRLAGVLHERGFGIAGESATEMERRRQAGEAIWFELGDDDLAICRRRRELLEDGHGLTDAHRAVTAHLDVGAEVLPMSDEPVRTEVMTGDGWLGLQEFMIRERCKPEIASVHFAGAETARPTAEVARALIEADLIVIGPSNPIISIFPILEVGGMRELVTRSRAPVVAVSPFVAGEILKGPTLQFMRAAGAEPSIGGVASVYAGIADALVADETADGAQMHVHVADVAMPDRTGERAVARTVLDFGASLR